MDLYPRSGISVTVVADSGSLEETPRKVTLAPTDVLSVDDLAPHELSSTSEGRARILLVEELPIRTPWVFSNEDDDVVPRHRELVVAETRRVIDLILGWARGQPRPFSEADVTKWDAWLAEGMPLAEDLVVRPPVRVIKRPAVPAKDYPSGYRKIDLDDE